ncbi:hypothetical protein ZWY2020_022998 [Hordeum vulgare]|nr:hypothetical protein ZWY2020_022998 [Hordeum vulgare]
MVEGDGMTVLESDVPKRVLHCDECHDPPQAVYQLLQCEKDKLRPRGASRVLLLFFEYSTGDGSQEEEHRAWKDSDVGGPSLPQVGGGAQSSCRRGAGAGGGVQRDGATSSAKRRTRATQTSPQCRRGIFSEGKGGEARLRCSGSECHGGKCRPCADLATTAVYVQSSYLDTLFGHIKLKEAWPYKKYSCTSSIPVGEGDPAAACELESCWFRPCPFKGSPADLVRHLTGRHALAAHKFTYGQDYIYDSDEMDSSLVYADEMGSWTGCEELLVGEDGGVFHLMADLTADFEQFPFPFVALLCVRNSAAAAAGPVYSYSVAAVDAPPAERRKLKPEIKEVVVGPDWKMKRDCFSLFPAMLREGKSVLVRICISKAESSSASC